MNKIEHRPINLSDLLVHKYDILYDTNEESIIELVDFIDKLSLDVHKKDKLYEKIAEALYQTYRLGYEIAYG